MAASCSSSQNKQLYNPPFPTKSSSTRGGNDNAIDLTEDQRMFTITQPYVANVLTSDHNHNDRLNHKPNQIELHPCRLCRI